MAWLSGCERSDPRSSQARDLLVRAVRRAGGGNDRRALGARSAWRSADAAGQSGSHRLTTSPLRRDVRDCAGSELLVRIPVLPLPLAFWLGVALLVAGGSLALWGQRTMRLAGTNVNPNLPTTRIVSSGPFRFSRNPLYLALTLLYLGLALAVNNLWALFALVPLLSVL